MGQPPLTPPGGPAPALSGEQARDREFMRRALDLARAAEQRGEVPVGAVLVLEGRIIGEAGNGPIGGCDPTAHAEVLALRRGALAVGNYRLPGSTLYVTLEPCPMCVGAMIHARIARLVYGAADPKSGAVGSVFSLLQAEQHNHRVAVRGGVLGEACAELLRRFFRARRGGAAAQSDEGPAPAPPGDAPDLGKAQ